MRAIPPLPVPTQPPSGPPPTTTGGGVEPWIIIVSVIAAVLFIAVLAGLLWGVRHLTYSHILLSLPYNHTTHPHNHITQCGFFSRKKHREIRRKRQALTDPTASTENILDAEVEPARNTINGKE